MIIDAHLDLAYNAFRGRDLRMPAREQPTLDDEIATVSFPDMQRGDVGCAFATIFCSPQTDRRVGYVDAQGAHDQAVSQLDQYDAWGREGWVKGIGNDAGFSSAALVASTAGRALSTLLLLEGAEAIRSPADAQYFFDRGVRIVGLSWQATRYAGGTATPGPLTPAGREIVLEFDRLGVLHDASHLAERSFWGLIDATDEIVIASHSNCRAIVGRDPNERHLTDAMIRAIAERGGVIGINFYDRFLLPAGEFGQRRATLADVVAHVQHICQLTGNANHVGIGTDLDGGLGREQVPIEIETIADLGKLRHAFVESGIAEADVEKIMCGNWQRVIATRWPASDF